MHKTTHLTGRVHSQDILVGATTLLPATPGTVYHGVDEIHLTGRLHTPRKDINLFRIEIKRMPEPQPNLTGAPKPIQPAESLGSADIWRNQISVISALSAAQFDRLATLVTHKRLASITLHYSGVPDTDTFALAYFQAGTDPDLVLRDDPSMIDKEYAEYQMNKEFEEAGGI